MSDIDLPRLISTLDSQAKRLFGVLEPLHRIGEPLPQQPRDGVALMLTRRTAELALAAADDFRLNRPQAGAVLARAILETSVVLRWCLVSDENAERWWAAGETDLQRSLRDLSVSQDPVVVAHRSAEIPRVQVPKVHDCAVGAGVKDIFDKWYSTLSSQAHPHRPGAMYAYSARGSTLLPVVMPCIYFTDDVGVVFTTWMTRREVPPALPHP